MYSKEGIYDEVMSYISSHGRAILFYRLIGGLNGFIKGILYVEVWETEDAVTFVSEEGGKFTLPVKIIDLLCFMEVRGEEAKIS